MTHHNIIHGHTKRNSKSTPEYRSWCSMKARCFNEKNRAYPSYGGRGISVCDEWKNDFLAFFNYVGKKPDDKHSIDRIDNNGNYEPGNVRWASAKTQNGNRRPLPFRNRIYVNCLYCQKKLPSSPTKVRKYCNYKCLSLHKSKVVDEVCVMCNKEFSMHRYEQLVDRKYCSKQCYNESQRKGQNIRKCAVCENTFVIHKKNRVHCSSVCRVIGNEKRKKNHDQCCTA